MAFMSRRSSNTVRQTPKAIRLSIPTYDNGDQPIHPGVVDLGGSPINGYRYWMAFTPLTDSNDAVENPSIVASNNGTTWEVPAGLTNPVIAKPEGGYNSDTDLVISGGTFYMYYRETVLGRTPQTKYYVVTSTDGVTWGDPTEYISSGTAILSPCVLEDGGTWRWWGEISGTVRHITSSDPLSFTFGGSTCSLANYPSSGFRVWHVNVFRYGSLFVMLINTRIRDTTPFTGDLRIGTSSDGLNFNFATEPLIKPTPGTWDESRIYQADGAVDGNTLKVWYSALDGSGWGTGYREFPVSVIPDPPA